MKAPGPETAIPAVVSGTLTTVDHKKISFQHFKNGAHAVIIIAHGYYSSKEVVILQQLARAFGGAYDIFMFDFRGHGKSSGVFTWTSREGNDLRAVLDFIAPQYSRKGLIAFSMGASISINVLATDKLNPFNRPVFPPDDFFNSAVSQYAHSMLYTFFF